MKCRSVHTLRMAYAKIKLIASRQGSKVYPYSFLGFSLWADDCIIRIR